MKAFFGEILGFLFSMIKTLPGTLRKTFCFEGRATRKDLWSYVFAYAVVIVAADLILELSMKILKENLVEYVLYLLLIILALLLIPTISLVIRRFHDLNLTGFWFWYLLPGVGLPVIYTTGILELDPSAQRVLDRISKFSSPWLSWILALILWCGSGLAFLLLFLYAGKDDANDFGASPYSAAK